MLHPFRVRVLFGCFAFPGFHPGLRNCTLSGCLDVRLRACNQAAVRQAEGLQFHSPAHRAGMMHPMNHAHPEGVQPIAIKTRRA